MDWLPILIDEEIEGYAVLPKILHVDQWGKYVLAKLVVDQDLIHFLVRSPRWMDGLVQV